MSVCESVSVCAFSAFSNYVFMFLYFIFLGIEHLRQKNLNQAIPDDEFFKKHSAYNTRVLKGLMSMLQLLGTTGDPDFDEDSYDPGEVVTIIRTTDIDALECFSVLCLKQIAGTAVWRQNYRKDTLSDAFTISDEAFAFLVLDNNREYWKLCYQLGEHNIPVVETTSASGRAHKRRKIDTKYTKRGSAGGTQGWNQEGIDTYNRLLQDVVRNRGSRESKELEGRLKMQWNADKMKTLQSTGMVVNHDDDGMIEPLNERDADIVDTW